MIFYLLLLLVVSGGAYLIFKKDNKKSVIITGIFALLILTAFCGSIDAQTYGTDIMNYYNNAYKAYSTTLAGFLEESPFEYGFTVFVWCITNLTASAQATLYIEYFLVFVGPIFVICKYSKNIPLSLLFYVTLGTFMFYFTAIRQGIACSLCILALELFRNKKRILGILLALLATQVHTSAIVFIPFVLLCGVQLTDRRLVLSILIMFMMSFFTNYFIGIGNDIMDSSYTGGSSTSLGGLINIVIYFGIVYLALNGRNNSHENKSLMEVSNDNYVLFASILGASLYVLRFYVLALERIAFYFLPFMSILFGEALEKQKIFPKPILNLIAILLIVMLYYTRLGHTFGEYVVFFM